MPPPTGCDSGAVRRPRHVVEAEHEDELRKVGYSRNGASTHRSSSVCWSTGAASPLEVGSLRGQQGRDVDDRADRQAVAERHGIEWHGHRRRRRHALLPRTSRPSMTPGWGSSSAPCVTKAPADLASHFRWHAASPTDRSSTTITTQRPPQECDPKMKAEPVWDPEAHLGSWRQYGRTSTKRAVLSRQY